MAGAGDRLDGAERATEHTGVVAPDIAIGPLLARAHGRLRVRLLQVLAGADLHLGHLAVLGAVQGGRGLTQSAVVRLTGIDKSSVALYVAALERDGWLARDVHARDRRVRSVRLTQSGAERLAELDGPLRQAEAAAFARLTAGERATLTRILAKLD